MSSEHEAIAHFERGALAGIGVVVTRAERGSRSLARRLEAHGARVYSWPTVEVEAAEIEAIGGLDGETFDWIVFTSARAVAPMVQRWPLPPKCLRVAVVGAATAEAARAAGWPVDHMPERYSAEHLVASWAAAFPLVGARILYPASSKASDALPRRLEALGAKVDRRNVYGVRSASVEGGPWATAIESREVDVVTFTSPSAVEGFAQGLGTSAALRLLAKSKVVAIGPSTALSLDRLGRPPDRVARPSTLDGLVRAVIEVASDLSEQVRRRDSRRDA